MNRVLALRGVAVPERAEPPQRPSKGQQGRKHAGSPEGVGARAAKKTRGSTRVSVAMAGTQEGEGGGREPPDLGEGEGEGGVALQELRREGSREMRHSPAARVEGCRAAAGRAPVDGH